MGHDYTECEKYNLLINPDELTTIGEKLKYYRLKENLRQEDLADYAKIDRTTYVSYEKGVNLYPFNAMLKFAEKFGIDVDKLLDDYHKFIYLEQGKNLKRIRKELGNMKQYELSDILGVSINAIRRAEEDIVRFSRRNYNNLMAYYNEYVDKA